MNDESSIDAPVTADLERLARSVHEEYLRNERRRGRTGPENPSMVPWAELPETLRESNRAQARDIPRKLEAIGCRVGSATEPRVEFAFANEEIERLAELEHDRWWLDQVVAGWTWGEAKSVPAGTSPDLAPWSTLAEDVQECDRDAMRSLPAVLDAAGLCVVRVTDAVAPPQDLVTLLDTCVPAFARLRPRFDELGRVLVQQLRELASVPSPTAIVTTRTKSVSGFVEKVVRKYPKYQDPLREITDLCGVRVIARTRTEVDAIADLVEQHFDVDSANSVSHTERLHPTEFGYRSVHYIVSLPGGVGVDSRADDLHTLKAEVQLRTVAEHASADFDHDFSYKGAFALPARWQRELAIIAAQVETIDEAFVRIEDGLRVYASSSGAYLDLEQLAAEIAKLRVMCTYAPDDPALTTRLARLLRASGDVRAAQRTLDEYCARRPERFAASLLPQPEATILRDLGEALCVRYADGSNDEELRRGRATLERACAALTSAGDRAHACICLGDSWGGGAGSRHWYEQAFASDPLDAHALSRYAESQIADGAMGVVAMLKPAIDRAIVRARAQIEVGVNLPRAHAVVGELFMLLGDEGLGLDHYAKGLRASASVDVVEEALRALDVLVAAPSTPAPLEWARRMLMLGSVARFRSPTFAPELVELATRRGDQVERIVGPVVIVVGGTAPELEAELASYAGLLVEACKDFAGTIVSGGTEQGISGIVGLVGTYDDTYRERITTIGYLPSDLPADGTATRDPRYTELRDTGTSEFGPGDHIQLWIDLFASGIRPADVTVIGINGGAVAGFELRLALALGARVGVIEHSGRAVDALLADADWQRLARGDRAQLVPLPHDAQTVRSFLGVDPPQLASADREHVARMAHEAYRQRALESYPGPDPAMQEFDRLPEYLRESNLRQADHIFAKLREIGCTAVPITEAPPFDGFDDSEVELLAEMEHGRWMSEKLTQGYARGEKKDDVARTHPHLLSWARLPEPIRDLDRAAVAQIPDQLATVGFTIVRRSASNDAPSPTS